MTLVAALGYIEDDYYPLKPGIKMEAWHKDSSENSGGAKNLWGLYLWPEKHGYFIRK